MVGSCFCLPTSWGAMQWWRLSAFLTHPCNCTLIAQFKGCTVEASFPTHTSRGARLRYLYRGWRHSASTTSLSNCAIITQLERGWQRLPSPPTPVTKGCFATCIGGEGDLFLHHYLLQLRWWGAKDLPHHQDKWQNLSSRPPPTSSQLIANMLSGKIPLFAFYCWFFSFYTTYGL